MKVQPRLFRLGPQCEVCSSRVCGQLPKPSRRCVAQLRKVAFHIHVLCSVTKEAGFRSHQALVRRCSPQGSQASAPFDCRSTSPVLKNGVSALESYRLGVCIGAVRQDDDR